MQTRIVAGRVYDYSHTIGLISGPGGSGFDQPVDLALDREQNIYVLSRSNELHRKPRFTVVTMDEKILRDVGSVGEGDGEFVWPTGIALDPDGNVYVSDEWLHRITIFDRKGNFLAKWGSLGPEDGELHGPSGLAFDNKGYLYVSDSQNNRVQKFTKEGKFILSWGTQGNADGQLDKPWGLAVDHQGNVFVADWGNDRVQKFSSQGKFLATFGSSLNQPENPQYDALFDTTLGRPRSLDKAGPGKLDGPSGVTVDKDGDVYVVDWGNDRIHVFAPDGSFLTTFVGDAQQLSQWAQQLVDASPDVVRGRKQAKYLESERRLSRPTSAMVSDDGEIIITDTLRHRLQIYQKLEGYVAPQFNI